MKQPGIVRALAWSDVGDTWADRLVYRKKAGYGWREDVTHIWEKWLVWKVLKLIPRPVKYYVVVQAATAGEKYYPGEVPANVLLKRIEEKKV